MRYRITNRTACTCRLSLVISGKFSLQTTVLPQYRAFR